MDYLVGLKHINMSDTLKLLKRIKYLRLPLMERMVIDLSEARIKYKEQKTEEQNNMIIDNIITENDNPPTSNRIIRRY